MESSTIILVGIFIIFISPIGSIVNDMKRLERKIDRISKHIGLSGSPIDKSDLDDELKSELIKLINDNFLLQLLI